MKNLINITIIFFALVLTFSSCDMIDKPFLQDSGINPIDTSLDKKVLLEDYTGFKCGNCPYAHQEANRLHDLYGDKVIIVAVHASFFANPDSKRTYDFRTVAGTEWDTFFGVSTGGLPKGMVNRIGYKESSHILPYSAWGGMVENALSTDAIVKIKLNAVYNSTNKNIDIDVDYEYKKMLTKYHNLNILIVEDSIINYQKWYNHTPEDVEDYVHNHVLRASVNGAWGDELTSQSGKRNYSFNIADKDWKPEHLKIIAFICDVVDTYEILQAEEVKLK